jgi:anti-sigma B factor antagonist
MSLTVQVRKNGKVVTLVLSGRLSRNDGQGLRELIQGQLSNGVRHFVLDLNGVSSIDSAGLGELVSAHTSVSSKGGSMQLSGFKPGTGELLKMTRLLTVFDETTPEYPSSRKSWLRTMAAWMAILLTAILLYLVIRRQ